MKTLSKNKLQLVVVAHKLSLINLVWYSLLIGITVCLVSPSWNKWRHCRSGSQKRIKDFRQAVWSASIILLSFNTVMIDFLSQLFNILFINRISCIFSILLFHVARNSSKLMKSGKK